MVRPTDIAQALKIGRRRGIGALGRAPTRRGEQMAKSTAEVLKAIDKLIEEYLAFQHSRPDLPQGSWYDLSQDDLELLVAAFQLHKSEQEIAEQGERPPRPH